MGFPRQSHLQARGLNDISILERCKRLTCGSFPSLFVFDKELFKSSLFTGYLFLVDEVDAKPMQYQTAKHEIRKRPLRANTALTLFHDLPRNAIHSLGRRFLHSRRAGGRSLACLHA
jgi:hypothetical protein